MIRDALAGFSDTVLTRIPKEILMKKLILASALSTLMAGAAFAQSAVVVYDDGVQKNARITDYDMTPATALATPEITYEGYAPIPDGDLAQLTADNLDDQTVYGVNNEAVGEIDELILTQGGQIDRVVLEVGGFLGLGEREVAIPFDRMRILRRDGVLDDFRIYIDSTEERLEALPEYEAVYD